jgi:hypothetical protein
MPVKIDPNYALIASIHGISGLIIFVTGVLQFLLKKAGVFHRFIGYLYFTSWIVIVATGIYIGALIIVAIVVMGFYMAVTGIRTAVLKGKPFALIDKGIVWTAVAIVLFMLFSTIYLVVKQHFIYASIASIFTILYAIVLKNDVLHYLFKKEIYTPKYGKMGWYIGHLIRMEVSFITAISAFVAVQNVFGNMILNFTLPGIIGGLLVVISKKYYVKKLKL